MAARRTIQNVNLADTPPHAENVAGEGDVIESPGLPTRPGGTADRSYAWDIAATYGADWYDLWPSDESEQGSITQIAKSHGVDAVELMVMLVAWKGRTPPSANQMTEFARKLALRKVGLVAWFKKEYPDRWKKIKFQPAEATTVGGRPKGLSFLPGAIMDSTKNSKGEGWTSDPLPPKTAGASDNAFERVSDNWRNVDGSNLIQLLKNVAERQQIVGPDGFVPRINWQELVAVLWAVGKKPDWIKKDLETNDGAGVEVYARALAHKGGTISLNTWFDERFGEERHGQRKPGHNGLLRDVDIPASPKTAEETAEERQERDDLLNPVVATMPGGYEVRRSEFEELRTKYRDLTLWYTGVLPEEEELTRWITDGTSDYQVTVELSQRDGFFRSPAWKSHSETYKGIFREMVGTEHKLPKHLIRKAIVHNWNEGDFSEQLRQRPIYLEGNEFKSGTATLQNIYLTVQGGTITSGVKTALKEAVLARWSKDQFTAWLRAQPEYETGREHTKKVRKFNAGLASFFGQPLSRVDLPTPQPVTAFDLPDSDRIEGAGDLSQDIEQDIDVRPAESFANPRGEVA